MAVVERFPRMYTSGGTTYDDRVSASGTCIVIRVRSLRYARLAALSKEVFCRNVRTFAPQHYKKRPSCRTSSYDVTERRRSFGEAEGCRESEI